jgi:hypothetical protein
MHRFPCRSRINRSYKGKGGRHSHWETGRNPSRTGFGLVGLVVNELSWLGNCESMSTYLIGRLESNRRAEHDTLHRSYRHYFAVTNLVEIVPRRTRQSDTSGCGWKTIGSLVLTSDAQRQPQLIHYHRRRKQRRRSWCRLR